MRKILVVAMAAVMLGAAGVMAGDTGASGQAKVQPKGEHMTLKGTLVCMSCSLKQTEGARSNCKLYGHTYSLLTPEGKYVTFLQNKYGEPLRKGEKYLNKEVTVDGTYYPSAQMVDVQDYTVDGNTMSWCDTHQKMDTCAMHKMKMK